MTSQQHPTFEMPIRRLWTGAQAPAREHATLRLVARQACLAIEVDAAFHADPAPPGPAASTPGLWDYEVVECFLLAAHARYLEIELGPHGHHLVLALDGVRQPVATHEALPFEAQRTGERWTGRAEVPWDWIPAGARHANAYAIHGSGSERRYLAWQAVPGEAPDFHRLEHFADIGALLQRACG